MVRAAVLTSGEGVGFQAILDALVFKEIENMELAAVICPQRRCRAMEKALVAKLPAYVVDPELFPNSTSHSMAVANKLRDLDIDLVIQADYPLPLGVVPYQFRDRIIAVHPALYPAFEDLEGDVQQAVLDRGLRLAGATACFVDGDGRVGGVILQKAIPVRPEDDVTSLSRRVMDSCAWPLLSQAVKLYCQGRLTVQGKKVLIREE